MRRWKVECGFWWVAMQVDKQGREIPGTAKRFPTHAEAMAYADQRARTREHVLPRLAPTRPIHKEPVNTQGVDNLWVKPSQDGVDIQHHFPPRQQRGKSVNTKGMHVPEYHLRPLALALLAHAERIRE